MPEAVPGPAGSLPPFQGDTVRLPAIPEAATQSAQSNVERTKGIQYEVGDLLRLVLSEGASDLHCRVGYPPAIRRHGELVRVDGPTLTSDGIKALVDGITGADHRVQLDKQGSCDFAFRLEHTRELGEVREARFRVNIFKSNGQLAIAARAVPEEIIPLKHLGVPHDAVERFISLKRGLVLVVGPTGSGKSTTLASIIDRINSERSDRHILSVEAPIEFVHRPKQALVSQREVPTDTPSFAAGVRDSLREDPNVILVGEMRDLETMEAALEAAETGHLVFATLHTTGAAKTVDRIISAFPENQQANVRIQLSTVLQGIVSQLLLPKINENGEVIGRVAVFEVMVMNPAIANNIRENKPSLITDAIQTGSREGMVTMDRSLLEAFKNRQITKEDVLSCSYDQRTMLQKLQELETA